MENVESLDCYKNWQNCGTIKTEFSPLWNSSDIELFEWAETLMTNEVPKNNIWNISATGKKLTLEHFYQEKKIEGICTKHYMCFKPTLGKNFDHILDHFKNYKFSYNFLKLTPGHNIVGHYDSYSTFIKRYNIEDKDVPRINRTAIFLDDWDFGQILQIGNSVAYGWNTGTAYTWTGDAWHGASNFGFSNFTVMQITWL